MILVLFWWGPPQNSTFLDQLQLNKLCYMTHGFVLRDNESGVFSDDVKAWPYGPVIPKIYDAIKRYKKNNVDKLYISGDFVLNVPKHTEKMLKKHVREDVRTIADKVVENYSELSVKTLINLSHQKGTPWSKTRNKHFDATIDNELIRNFYKEDRSELSGI